MTTPPRTLYTAETVPIPVPGHPQPHEPGHHQYPGAGPETTAAGDPGYFGPGADPQGEAQQRRWWLRGCGILALVVTVRVIALIVGAYWVVGKAWGPVEDTLDSFSDSAPAATQAQDAPAIELEAPAAPEPVAAPELPASAGQLQDDQVGWATDKARRLAYTTTTATEHGMIGADAETTYDQITALCTFLEAGADPASTLFGFVNDNSTAVTATPMAKITATGMSIQCPAQYTAAVQNLQLMAPDVEIPGLNTFEWLP